MKVAVHQPQYFPWPRYIHKIMSADLFVYLDTAQYSKNGVQNRNQVKSAAGPTWITVPIKNRLGQRIADAEIADDRAFQKHLRTIAYSYGSTPGFSRWNQELHDLLGTRKYSTLGELGIATTDWLLDKLGSTVKTLRASSLDLPCAEGSKLVAEICRSVCASTYLTGTGGLEYMKQEDFTQIGCQVHVQTWSMSPYAQVHPAVGFIHDLSTLDILLTHPDEAGDLIAAAGGWQRVWSALEA